MTEESLAPVEPVAPQTDALTEQQEAPRPVGTKPQQEESKPEQSRSDAVRKAIEKATTEKPDEKAEAKPAEKSVERQAEKTDKAEAKPDESKAERLRQPDGKFSRPDSPDTSKPTAFREPPQRFDDAARSEWEAVPESVRGAIHRSHKEMEQGIQKYREAAEAYEPVRRFDELARQNGGNLEQSLRRVVEIEQAFARNPVEGFQRIADHFGIDLHRLAAAIAGQSPQQVNDQRLRMQMADLQRQNQMLQQQAQAERQQREMDTRRNEATNTWAEFRAAMPRAAELETAMADFLQKYPAGDNVPLRDRLEDAYAFAVAKHPSAAHTGDTALAQTQRQPNPAGQKSIAGAPNGDAKSSTRKLSRAEAARNAMRQHGVM